MRTVSASIIRAMRQKTCRMALMAEIDHPAGMVRVWTGIGTLTYGGHGFVGIGALASVKGLKSTSDLQIVDHAYVLTNIPPDYDEFVNAKIKGRVAKCWLAFLDEQNQLIDAPLQIGKTILDVSALTTGEDGSVSLMLKGQSDLWQLEKPLNIALTSEEQKKRFPSDTGFDYVTTINVQRIAWTRI